MKKGDNEQVHLRIPSELMNDFREFIEKKYGMFRYGSLSTEFTIALQKHMTDYKKKKDNSTHSQNKGKELLDLWGRTFECLSRTVSSRFVGKYSKRQILDAIKIELGMATDDRTAKGPFHLMVASQLLVPTKDGKGMNQIFRFADTEPEPEPEIKPKKPVVTKEEVNNEMDAVLVK